MPLARERARDRHCRLHRRQSISQLATHQIPGGDRRRPHSLRQLRVELVSRCRRLKPSSQRSLRLIRARHHQFLNVHGVPTFLIGLTWRDEGQSKGADDPLSRANCASCYKYPTRCQTPCGAEHESRARNQLHRIGCPLNLALNYKYPTRRQAPCGPQSQPVALVLSVASSVKPGPVLPVR